MVWVFAVLRGFDAPNFSQYWFASISCIILFAAGNIALAESLQRIEASVFTVIFATSVAWIMLFGTILFGEPLGLWHVIGSLLTFISILLLVETRGRLKFDRGILFGLLSGLLFGLAVIGWVYVGRKAEPISWQAITFIAPSLLIALVYPKSLAKAKPLLKGRQLNWLLLASFTFAVSTTALLYAYKHGQINQVAPLQQSSIIFTVILAVIFLKETKNLTRKIVSALICFAGVLMIVS